MMTTALLALALAGFSPVPTQRPIVRAPIIVWTPPIVAWPVGREPMAQLGYGAMRTRSGTKDHAEALDAVGLRLAADWSVEATFRMLAVPSATVGIVTKGRNYKILVVPVGGVMYVTAGFGIVQPIITPTLVLGEWYSAGVTWNSATEYISLYLVRRNCGGVYVTSTSQHFAGATTYGAETYPLRIGASDDGSGVASNIGDAAITEVRLSSVVRDLASFTAGYATRYTGNESGLVALYTADDGIEGGATIQDKTGNGYDATFTGVPLWSSAPEDLSY